MNVQLDQYRVLIAGDQGINAAALGYELAGLGASILGPATSIRASVVLLISHGQPDAAILDIGLAGKPVYPLVDILMECAIPVIFLANHNPMIMPAKFAHIPLYNKSVDVSEIAVALQDAIKRWDVCA